MSEPSIYQIPSLQTAAFIARMRNTFDANQSNDLTQRQSLMGTIMSDFHHSVGREIAKWDPITEGDPPFSGKLNGFFSDLELDSTVLSTQIETLASAVTAAHNLIKTEILHSVGENARLNNKLKTLQLYSTSVDNDLYVFGDSFISNEHVDRGAIGSNNIGEISGDGTLTLAKSAVSSDPLQEAVIEILPSSNGVLGNNQEFIPNPDNIPGVEGAFAGQTHRHADLEDITDALPTTWIEYENVWVSKDDKDKAEGFNFKYTDNRSSSAYGSLIPWGDGPTDENLILDCLITLKKPAVMNTFQLIANELTNKENQPIKISSVQVSSDKTNWVLLTPEDVWLTTNVNLDTVRHSSNMSIGSALWKFDPQLVGYIRLTVEQPNYIPALIGHAYFMTKEQIGYRRKDSRVIEGIDPGGDYEKFVIPPKRAEGPIPPITDPFKYFEVGREIHNLVEKVEYFPGKRWVIALRDISGSETSYSEESVLVSKKFSLPKIIDRVVLESDIEIPSVFDTDEQWVKFYISPDDGANWYQISRVQDTYNDVPEIIAFNDPTPIEFRDQNVGYHDTGGTVNSLRVKIELSRPSAVKSITPIVRGYKLKIRTRD